MPAHRRPFVVLSVLVLVSMAGLSRADTLEFQDGRRVHGRLVSVSRGWVEFQPFDGQDTVEQIRVAANPQLSIEGVLRTMFDPRNNLANEVSAQLVTHFGDKVFRTIIPRNIRLAEAPSFGKPALFHDRESRGALAYLALAGEMIRREEEAYAARARAAVTGDSSFAAAAGNEAANELSTDHAVGEDTST